MPALLFGSISAVADTSELQRAAFNAAFEAHGLDWRWDREDYRQMLTTNGGQDRVAAFADSRGEDVDAAAVHATKSRIFQDSVAGAGLIARPGVADAVSAAHAQGWTVGLVTTTSADNVSALLGGLPELSADDFDVVVDADSVEASKPDPAAYEFALAQLGEQADACVAVEDNVGGVQSATGAGVVCAAFPNANTTGQDFGSAPVIETVDFATLAAMPTAAGDATGLPGTDGATA